MGTFKAVALCSTCLFQHPLAHCFGFELQQLDGSVPDRHLLTLFLILAHPRHLLILTHAYTYITSLFKQLHHEGVHKKKPISMWPDHPQVCGFGLTGMSSCKAIKGYIKTDNECVLSPLYSVSCVVGISAFPHVQFPTDGTFPLNKVVLFFFKCPWTIYQELSAVFLFF